MVFSRLLALTNMPIQRFALALRPEGLESYNNLLRLHHRQENLPSVMCRSLVSVDWQGRLHDCDFNQQLGLGLPEPRHLRDLLDWDPCGGPILVGGHCFGCTAGAGSSCGGSLA